MLEHVRAVAIQLRDRRVERDRDLLAGLVAGRADPVHQQLERLLVGVEVGREPALVADRGRHLAVVERLLQLVEDLVAHPQRLREAGGADRHDHELLEVEQVVGVGAAVEHVHHRDRHHVRGLAAQVAPQRQPLLGGGGVRGGQRHRQDRVRPEPRLVRRPVERDQQAVERRLPGHVLPADRVGDLAVDVRDGLA